MYRNIVLMMHYNTDTQEIARPSEVLLRIQSYVSTLRSLELYGTNISIKIHYLYSALLSSNLYS